MITVQEAENIILQNKRDFGNSSVPLQKAVGKVLAESVYADRDMPPFNRATMDGIGISFLDYSNGQRLFNIAGTQGAGERHLSIPSANDCIEIMTGAALHPGINTVIPYEDLEINSHKALIKSSTIKEGQNIHKMGIDGKKGDLLLSPNEVIDPVSISILASVGKANVLVKSLPKIIIISTGDELVDVEKTPSAFQIRRSNNLTIEACLKPFGIEADLIHFPDDFEVIKSKVSECIHNYDVILLSGAVSKGKYDYVPAVLDSLGFTKQFHQVKQRPGKPFLFGNFNNKALVFGFPGNPVSSFFCLHRYFITWLKCSLGLQLKKTMQALLSNTITFKPQLDYYIPVKLSLNENGQLLATPYQGNGSGDFANLRHCHAFMELPAEQNTFTEGIAFRIWPYASFI